jgi:alkanesulfonate monooxygenase SsuD/methylene tetrahydromethanopterin reductase-like flavin-dependent oxidoreductase (luciferase family)
MDFGIFTMFTVREDGTQAEAFREWFGIVQAAEEMGLDTFWIGESHFWPERAVMTAPLIGASAVAARTERIKVGLAVQVLPLANLLRIAEDTVKTIVYNPGMVSRRCIRDYCPGSTPH